MKRNLSGIALAVILMAAMGFGLGIAQAGGDKALSLEDQCRQLNSASSGSNSSDPVSTGGVPQLTNEEFAKIAEAERAKYVGMKDIDGH
ncbi:MAG: hypothetical protein IH628_14525 [Proteobacteria bacterium]|nr:hypothetical protein [Pseudomonadota bacterium]